jgi:hypothetical protein
MIQLVWDSGLADLSSPHQEAMDDLKKKPSPRKTRVRKSSPKQPKRPLPDVRKYAGAVPGMSDWALDEVRRMRDEW